MKENSDKCLIVVASWEERFEKGVYKQIGTDKPSKVLVFFYAEFHARTAPVLERVSAFCDGQDVELTICELKLFNPAESWTLVNEQLGGSFVCREVILDITTAPREFIWTVLDLLWKNGVTVKIVYHEPASYGDWQSSSPGRPRVVYKLGGESKLGAPTKLLIVTGYDLDRVQQLISFFEPEETVLCVQTGVRANNERAQSNYQDLLSSDPTLKASTSLKLIDSYSAECGQSQIEEAFSILGPELNNILLCSLGPKLSALPLYSIHRKNKGTALVYAPSSHYNKDYSSGLARTYSCETYGEFAWRGQHD